MSIPEDAAAKKEILELREQAHDVRKAQSLAIWSYVGLIIPLLGWILAGISISLSKSIPDTGKLGERAKKARTTAKISIIVSVLIILAWGMIIYLSVQGTSQQQPGQIITQKSNSSQLSSCLDNVDSWFTTNATTNGEALALLPNKEQQVSECQSRYPTVAASSNQSQHQTCLNNVDDWWGREASTVGLANMMLPLKKQMVAECGIRYPIS